MGSSEDGKHGARGGVRCKREEHSAGLWRSLCDMENTWRIHVWHGPSFLGEKRVMSGNMYQGTSVKYGERMKGTYVAGN